jgi:FkbM family methyltransferase
MIGWLGRRATAIGGPRQTTVTAAGTTAELTVPTDLLWDGRDDYHSERDVLRNVLVRVAADDVVWDIGADIGVWSALVGQPADQVVAVEPDRGAAQQCARNAERNGVAATVRSVAVGATGGRAELVGRSTRRQVRPTDGGAVRLRTVDGLVSEGLPAPDLLKIDVEGMEGAVLAGATAALEGCRLVVVEAHGDKGDPEAVRDQLIAAGFSVAKLGERRSQAWLVGARSRRVAPPAAADGGVPTDD